MARLVLPSPGGPDSSTWSGGRPRRSALSSTSPSCSRTRGWPTKSASRRGRSAASTSRSSVAVRGTARRRRGRSLARRQARRGQRPAREQAPSTAGRRPSASGGHRGDRPPRPPGAVQPRPTSACRTWSRHGATGGDAGAGAGGCSTGADPVPQLQHQPLGALPADARHPGQRRHVAVATARRTASGGCTASTAWASRGPDPARRLQQLEQRPLVVVGEAVQGQRVLPDDQAGGQPGRLADPQPGQRAGRARTPPGRRRRPRPPPRPGRARPPAPCTLRDHRRAPSRPAARWPGSAADGRGRACAPPRQTWQIASASASAASAGRGALGQPQQPGHHRRHLRLVRPAGAGHRRLDLARGVQRDRQRRPAPRPGSPPPPACAVPITVRTLCWLKTRSTATTSGACSATSGVQLAGRARAAARPRPPSGRGAQHLHRDQPQRPAGRALDHARRRTGSAPGRRPAPARQSPLPPLPNARSTRYRLPGRRLPRHSVQAKCMLHTQIACKLKR